MSRIKRFVIVIYLVVILVTASSCQVVSSAPDGSFYLDGSTDNAYIQILGDNQLKLVDFDIDTLVNGLEEATGFEGYDLEYFREQYDLPEIFSNDLEFEFSENRLFLQLTSWVGYYLMLEDANTILFNGDKYIRQ